jgi:hypothetical protein
MMPSKSARVVGAIAWLALCATACGQDPLSDTLPGDPSVDATAADAESEAGSIATDDGGGLYTNDGQVLVPTQGPTGPGDACAPATGCPSGFQCGHYTDPCTGHVFACGESCEGGTVCVRGPNDPSSQTCQAKACAGHCGVVGVDGCGVAITCGGCPTGEDCVATQCVPAAPPVAMDAGTCGAISCTPDSKTHLCGTVTDGCGHSMGCSCPAGETCSGGVCGALAPECTTADGGVRCSTAPNSCGSANVTCGSCPGGQCVQGMCTTCAPLSCGKMTCGKIQNPCGESMICGTCDSGSCYDGLCCTPSTCAEVNDGGPPDCAPVNLGCGVSKSCAPCPEGDVCTNHVCVACMPKSCSDFNNAGCGHSDGCGKTVNCCSKGTTCQGTICCDPGEVAYAGSCCLPSCDPNQPPGAQESCGQVIVCAPGQKGPPR